MVGLSKLSKETEILERLSDDVVVRYTIRREEIHLRGSEMSLESQIKRLDAEIMAVPMRVEYPEKAADAVKAAIDAFNGSVSDATELQARKAELVKLRDEYAAVKIEIVPVVR